MNSQQDSRKILEDLNFKKQQLLASSQAGNAGKGITPTITTQLSSVTHEPPVSTQARAAFTQAQASSLGFFIPQDSQFGNNILPVLPRFD